jgi:hypothetical protein
MNIGGKQCGELRYANCTRWSTSVAVNLLEPITVAERSSPAQTLGSWVQIPLKGMDVCVHLFCVCAVLCTGSGLATG